MSHEEPGLSWRELRMVLQQIAEEAGEWAGLPLPIDNLRLVMEPRYPFPKLDGFSFEPREQSEEAIQEMVASGMPDHIFPINLFYVHRRRVNVLVYHAGDGRSRCFVYDWRDAPSHRVTMLLNTISGSRAWDWETEVRAQDKLCTILNDTQRKDYLLTGSFLESSPRSKVVYLFRRGRPTLALAQKPHEESIRVLCSMCLHPSGYYENSFAGCMTPSDEIICHLTLMRGDEHRFWSKSNQHPASLAESGL